MKYFIFVLAMFVVTGCVTTQSAQQINAEGNLAFIAGHYETAREQYARALMEAQKSGNQQYTAIAMYGLGRSNGYLCNYKTAEEWLIKSISLRGGLPDLDSDRAYLSQNLLELARLYMVQRKFKEANIQFARAVPILEKLKIEARDPIAYVDTLNDYEISLRALGNIKEATAVEERITFLKNKYPSRQAIFTAKPYPSSCT